MIDRLLMVYCFKQGMIARLLMVRMSLARYDCQIVDGLDEFTDLSGDCQITDGFDELSMG